MYPGHSKNSVQESKAKRENKKPEDHFPKYSTIRFENLNEEQTDAAFHEELVHENESHEYDEDPGDFLKGLTKESAREKSCWMDPKGWYEKIESGDAYTKPDKESLEKKTESQPFTLFPEGVEKRKYKNVHYKKISDVFGEESEAKEDAREQKVTPGSFFEEYQVGKERKRGEDPEKRVGINNFAHTNKNRREGDSAITKKGGTRTNKGGQEKIK